MSGEFINSVSGFFYFFKIQDMKECNTRTIKKGIKIKVCILKAKSLLKNPKVKNPIIW